MTSAGRGVALQLVGRPLVRRRRGSLRCHVPAFAHFAGTAGHDHFQAQARDIPMSESPQERSRFALERLCYFEPSRAVLL
jgi:hypothetical protein